ncbi:MAG: hypothetical protein APF80_06970 [Alphaproteobacteria bacterium BRH_c36]|nr:MAG: hypothetical protein APF80_06970 [Alphaproteobacteria bacterium BRH_c36]
MLRLRRVPRSTRIDLQTVRETLSYIRDDVAADPALANVASALSRAITEIDSADSRKNLPRHARAPFDARFFPNRL